MKIPSKEELEKLRSDRARRLMPRKDKNLAAKVNN